MALTATALRTRLYEVLDSVLATGRPVEIVRKGRKLLIVPEEPPVSLTSLIERPDYICGDPDQLIHLDWSDEWTP